ncbi:response regulator transcription factor [Pseudonocardia acidicola]|uniref:Response regulator transcription factor n=1 Tax=Pseudonocardia acidicola TaxID=2724939 RepID=A0ABX1SJ47_9PSEU|nr:response regulator transcription factor [Pseudonocardia acidicola]NMI00838.1 response regulator transcription factor [Pseudonocardia acidicola]
MRRSILVIDDDARIRRMVALALSREGFVVGEAASGEEGLAALRDHGFDVICVDLVLPGCDGFQVCRDIRRTSTVPIIAVGARVDSHDVVGGLEAGADDCISKPFRVQELCARIRALLRRAEGTGLRGSVHVGDLEIVARDGLALRDGEPLDLTPTELRLLCELAVVPGRVLSRAELLERVWGYGYFGDPRVVDVNVARLRRKVEPDPQVPKVVVTVRGQGYRLAV